MGVPRPSTGTAGVVQLLVALALPGVRAVRVGRRRPHAPDGHTVVVKTDHYPVICDFSIETL